MLTIAEGDILDILIYDEDLADHDIVGISRKVITASDLGKREMKRSFGRVDELHLDIRPHARTPNP